MNYKLNKSVILAYYYVKNSFKRESSVSKLVLFSGIFFNSLLIPLIYGLLTRLLSVETIPIIAIFLFMSFLTTGLSSTEKSRNNNSQVDSFLTLGYGEKDFYIGIDIAKSFFNQIGNFVYLFILLSLLVLQGANLILIFLYTLLFIAFIPICYLIRNKILLTSYISFNTVFESILNYQTWILILLINNNSFSFDDRVWMLIAIVVSITLLSKILSYLLVNKFQSHDKSPLITELIIAYKESGFNFSSAALSIFIWPIFALGLLMIVYDSQLLQEGNYHMMLGYVGYFVGALFSCFQIAILYMVGFDSEQSRILKLKYFGHFIEYKINYKMKISFIFTVVIVLLFTIFYLLLIPETIHNQLIFLVGMIPWLLNQSVFFFVGTILFAEVNRDTDEYEGGSKIAKTFGFLLSTVSGLATFFYLSTAEKLINPNIVIVFAVNLFLFYVCKVFVHYTKQKKYGGV